MPSYVIPKTINKETYDLIEKNNDKIKYQGKLFNYFIVSGVLFYFMRLIHILIVLYAIMRITEADYNDRILVIQRILLAARGVKSTLYNYIVFMFFFIALPQICRIEKISNPISVHFFGDNKKYIILYSLFSIATYMINYYIDHKTMVAGSIFSSEKEYRYDVLSLEQLKYLLYAKGLLTLLHIPIQALMLMMIVNNFMKVNIKS